MFLGQEFTELDSDAGDCLDVISSTHSIDTKFNALVVYCEQFGLTDIFYGREGTGEAEPVLYKKWNKAWTKLYEQRRYAVWDEARRVGKWMKHPFSLRIASPQTSERQAEFYAEAERYNRLNGFALPLAERRGAAGGFSATGVDQPLPYKIVLSVSAAAYVFDLSVNATRTSEAAKQYKITPRQRLFLQLLSEGHTHRDMAVIVGVSEDWAHKIFARLRQKLDVRTDAALMCKAIQLGLLF